MDVLTLQYSLKAEVYSTDNIMCVPVSCLSAWVVTKCSENGSKIKESTLSKQSHAFCKVLILDSNWLAVHVGVVWDDEVELGLDKDMEVGRRASAGI